jgi:hypothetical protein
LTGSSSTARLSRLEVMVWVSVVITGATAWTWMLSVTAPTSRAALTRTDLPGARGTWPAWKVRKPAASIGDPVGSGLQVERFVVALGVGLQGDGSVLPRLVMVTFAEGTTAPLESVTVPRMLPKVDCAGSMAGAKSNSNNPFLIGVLASAM